METSVRVGFLILALLVVLSGPAVAREQSMAPGASVQDYRSALMRDRGIRPTRIPLKRQSTQAAPKSPAAKAAGGGAAKAASPTPAAPQQQAEVYSPPESAGEVDFAAGAGVSVQVYFAYDSALLTDAAKVELDKLGEALASPEFSGDRWFIEGHTDSAGSEGYNEELSQRRAISVMSYLVERYGIQPDALIPVGKGESEPLDPAHPMSSANRRVRVKHLGGG